LSCSLASFSWCCSAIVMTGSGMAELARKSRSPARGPSSPRTLWRPAGRACSGPHAERSVCRRRGAGRRSPASSDPFSQPRRLAEERQQRCHSEAVDIGVVVIVLHGRKNALELVLSDRLHQRPAGAGHLAERQRFAGCDGVREGVELTISTAPFSAARCGDGGSSHVRSTSGR